ncbi:HET-domain-containing protein [Amniculicola lignicola CBS 123094]|uniref:HET-domain-containing protein n=1 Tax=Amniculicola lignicola CBS 123094 TaxID=1392246 RepID=A0A6A5WZY5_9PLEO|nr:HET-domain-containing protein [Amniculicola lignicola CBS 123094]
MDGPRLSCRIFWTSLSNPTPFKALSYTWGKGGFTQTIDASGADLKITETLEEAMKHIRHPTEPITLWIDQICINQQDDLEKSEQVAHMSHIYRNAEEVFVWLGPACDNSDLFMDAASTVGQWAYDFGMMDYYKKENVSIFMRIINKENPEDPKTIEFHDILKRAVALIDEEVLVAMVKWHKRMWFTRVWVVQEFCLSDHATFICGLKRAKSDPLLLFRQVLSMGAAHIAQTWPMDAANRAMGLLQAEDTSGPFFALRNRRKLRDAGSGKGDGVYDLLQKLFVNNKLNATQACDTVYGMLAIATDAEELGLRPDYTLKDRVDLIYVRLAKAIIKTGHTDILALAQSPKGMNGIPSWVPDWTSKLKRPFAWQTPEEVRWFNASKELSVELVHTEDEFVLGLKGFKVDEIEEVAGMWDGNDSLNGTGENDTTPFGHQGYITYLAQIRLLLRLSAIKNKDIYPSPERRVEALWRIPVGDLEQNNAYETSRATPKSAEAYEMCVRNLEYHEQWKAMTNSEFWLRHTKQKEEVETNIGGLYRTGMYGMRNKRPFLTQEGYVGLGPLYVQPKDIVVVFKGASIPYIIRPLKSNDGEKRYRFLCECYCDGIMDGEIVERRDTETFLLSGEGMVS